MRVLNGRYVICKPLVLELAWSKETLAFSRSPDSSFLAKQSRKAGTTLRGDWFCWSVGNTSLTQCICAVWVPDHDWNIVLGVRSDKNLALALETQGHYSTDVCLQSRAWKMNQSPLSLHSLPPPHQQEQLLRHLRLLHRWTSPGWRSRRWDPGKRRWLKQSGRWMFFIWQYFVWHYRDIFLVKKKTVSWVWRRPSWFIDWPSLSFCMNSRSITKEASSSLWIGLTCQTPFCLAHWKAWSHIDLGIGFAHAFTNITNHIPPVVLQG